MMDPSPTLESSDAKRIMTSKPAMPCELITANQLADLLNLSERTLYRLKSTGAIPKPISLGGSVRWSLTEIRIWIEQGCPRTDPRE